MNFPAQLFPVEWAVAAFLPLLAAIVWALATADWRALLRGPHIHVWPASMVALALLWSMSAGVQPGLNLHLLGTMACVLAFGPRLALIALLAVLAAVTLNGAADWSAYALNAVVMVIVPVWIAHAIFRLVDRHLPNHFFVYVFVTAFLGSALTIAASGLTASILLFAAGVYPFGYLLQEYLPYLLLLAFAEAWLSGMAVTVMVVYRPQWISTFDDSRYLLNK